MKRLLAVLLAVLLLLSSFTVLASEDNAEEMEKVLLKVKEKIAVPDELTEFSGNVSDYNSKKTYHFNWRTEDYEKTLSVSSDADGRITSYSDNAFKSSDKKISSVSIDEIIKYAEKFLRKTLPDAFTKENDGLFYDSYSASQNLTYTLTFKRLKNAVFVKDNYATITLCVVDNEIFVRRMNVNFKYDAEFAEDKDKLENINEKYKEAFPVELIYMDTYVPFIKDGRNEPAAKLIYRIKDNNTGYMDISSGEILTEDVEEEYFSKNESVSDSVMGSAGGGGLTPQEIKELETIKGLKSVEQIEEIIKNLPYINFSDDLVTESKSLFKGSNEQYFYNINYISTDEEKGRYIYLKANAKTDEIISLSNNDYTYYDSERKELSEEETKEAETKIDEFLGKVGNEKLSQTTEIDSPDNYGNVNRYFERILNGVKFIGNGINVSFDTKKNMITHYSVNFTEGEFPHPDDAVDSVTAYEKILKYSPIIEMYILNGGVYRKCVTLEKHSVTLEAISGEIENAYFDKEYKYSDIENHWVKEAATKLSEIQVGLSGGVLDPEKEISQEEFLNLTACAIWGNYYSDYKTDELYDILTGNKIISKEDRNPESSIKREDAFVYIIRYAGLERVAQLTDIFKVNFADESEVSKEKIGYAAILSGFGVVNGNGGKLRPQENLTRAEAISLIYKYLISF